MLRARSRGPRRSTPRGQRAGSTFTRSFPSPPCTSRFQLLFVWIGWTRRLRDSGGSDGGVVDRLTRRRRTRDARSRGLDGWLCGAEPVPSTDQFAAIAHGRPVDLALLADIEPENLEVKRRPSPDDRETTSPRPPSRPTRLARRLGFTRDLVLAFGNHSATPRPATGVPATTSSRAARRRRRVAALT